MSKRTLRQILHGCKKHHYVYFRDIKWFEDAYRFGFKTKLLCRKCMHIENSKIDMMICRSKIDEIAYGNLKQNESSEQAQKPLRTSAERNGRVPLIGEQPVNS